MTDTARDRPRASRESAQRSNASIPPAKFQFFAIAFFACGVNILFQALYAFSPAISPLIRALVETTAVAIVAVPPAYWFYMRPRHRSLKQLEIAGRVLRKSEMHYRIVSELTTTFVFDLLVDANGRVSLESISGNYQTFAGQDESVPTFESLFSHIHPDDRDRLSAVLRRLVERPRSEELECRVFVRDPHELRWVSIYGRSEAENDPGRVTAICGAVKDITQGKAAERALAESGERLQKLADSFQGFIAYVRADTLTYEFVNETYATQFGLPRERIVGSHVQDIIGGEAYAVALKNIEEVRAGRACSYENVFDLVSGKRWVQVNFFPVFGADGRVESIAVLNYDISDRKRAEEEQARVRNLLEISQRLAHIGSWEYELSTGTLSWSDEMYRIAGLPVGSPVSRETVETFFPPQELLRSRKTLSSVLHDASSYSADYTITRRDGRAIVIHNEGEMIKDEHGNAVRILGTTQDITARKLAEDELRRSEQIIDAMLNAIPAGVFWKDTDLVFLGCNQRFARDAGFDDPADIIGRDDYEIGCPKEHADAFRRDDRRVIEGGAPILGEEDLKILNAKPVAHLTSRVPLRNADGRISGVLGTYVDITDRKLAETKLRESEENFRSIIEQSADGILVIDKNGAIAEWNIAQEGITGLKKSDVLGVPAWEVDAYSMPEVTPERSAQIKTWVLGMLSGDGNWEPNQRFEHSMKLTDGATRLVSEHVFVIKKGSENMIVSIASDVTEKKKAEHDRLLAEQYLQRAQRLESLGVLAGGIAHDFNNILTSIYGFMELAIDQTRDPGVAEYLSQATNSMERAKALTQQLLTFSKGGAPVRKLTQIGRLVRETSLFAASGSNVRCNLSVAPDLWSCNVDRNQIAQVIQNLMLNAVQATPMGGEIEVSSRNIALQEKEHPSLAPGNYVQISVKDRGIGISEAMLSKIFDPFFTTKTQGHGLGLAISHSIVLRHNGVIEVESELGKGTTFRVTIPASLGLSRGDREPSTRTHSGSGTILVMDDEEGIRRLLSRMLRSAGYEVIGVDNGKETIELFVRDTSRKKKFAAVILDLTIPGGIGGKEVAEAIRAVDKDVPLFVASGYAADQIMAHPHDYGFDASISKPFRMGDLMEMLETHLKAD
jgi:PAS domain S-box-containing protein